MARRIGRSEFAQEAVGFLLANYLRFVKATSRFTTVPADLDAHMGPRAPLIAAMWHGQHLMIPLGRPKTVGPYVVLISRHEDAGAQASAARRLGIEPVRGSGGPVDRQYYKGGAPALRQLLRLLDQGTQTLRHACGEVRLLAAQHAGQPMGALRQHQDQQFFQALPVVVESREQLLCALAQRRIGE